MKTRILTLAAFAAALFTVSCAKENPVATAPETNNITVNEEQGFIFDITASKDDDTKANKSAWETGDQILLCFENDVTLGHQLRLTFNGSAWDGAFDDNDFAATFKDGDNGKVYAMCTAYPIELTDKYETSMFANLSLNNYQGGYMLTQSSVDYTVEAEAEKLKFKTSLSLGSMSTYHIAIAGLDDEDPTHWTMQAQGTYNHTAEKGWLGAEINPLDRVFFRANYGIGNWSSEAPVKAYTNGDHKVCFSFSPSLHTGDIVITLTNNQTGKKYFRIMANNTVKDNIKKLMVMNISKFTEKKSNIECNLRDADGNWYTTVKLADNNWWMAENLRTIPAGLTPSSDLTNVTAGIYYPVVVNGSTAAFSTDNSTIRTKGYLYQSETALGVAVNSISTEDEAKALEGCQGICPNGWHIPTITEITGLIGKAVSPITTVTTAPYYNGSNGSIALLNADNFNIDTYGAVSIIDNTKTAATLMGALKGYEDRTTSGYIAGSSFATISLNTDSSIKNLQFWGLMPMSNKASVDDYTCNGTKLSYKIGASVRCIKNK